MHIGNLRTAFYAYALAKRDGGDFVLRIEDTDKKREVAGGVADIKDLVTTFGLKWDEFYIQSERLALYKKAAERMVSSGHAFYCECEARNAKKEGFSADRRDQCRDKGLTSGAIKLKVPDGEIVKFRDFVLREEVEWNTDVVFDATLLKSDGFPTYHLAVVVDDHDMDISHVLRGHDWLPSTPIHLLTYKYLGYEVPEIGHLTDILDPEGGKLSKRKGSTSVRGLLSEGYLPEAIFNFVILAGWAPKDNREIFTLKDFVGHFDPNGFQKSNPIFNREKLDWFNGHYIRQKTDEEFFNLTRPYLKNFDDSIYRSIIPLIKDRIKKLSDVEVLAEFFFEKPTIGGILTTLINKDHLKRAIEALEKVDEWTLDNINETLSGVITGNQFKTGDFYMSLRIAVTGSKFTPPINESIEILGKEETLKRIKVLL